MHVCFFFEIFFQRKLIIFFKNYTLSSTIYKKDYIILPSMFVVSRAVRSLASCVVGSNASADLVESFYAYEIMLIVIVL